MNFFKEIVNLSDYSIEDHFGCTALTNLCKYKSVNIEKINILLKKVSNLSQTINKQDKTPLMPTFFGNTNNEQSKNSPSSPFMIFQNSNNEQNQKIFKSNFWNYISP